MLLTDFFALTRFLRPLSHVVSIKTVHCYYFNIVVFIFFITNAVIVAGAGIVTIGLLYFQSRCHCGDEIWVLIFCLLVL